MSTPTLRRFTPDQTAEAAAFYRTQGYAVLAGLFAPAELEQIAAEVCGLFEARFAAEGIRGASPRAVMLEQYHANRQIWRQCASKMWDVLAVLRCAAKPEIAELLRAFGLRRPIVSTRPEVRTDMPADEQFMQPWHQDWIYAQTSLNAVTFWTPLHDVTTANGAIEIIPGSHLLGAARFEELSNPRRFLITDERIDEAARVPVELQQGECVLFSHFLVHRSGRNSSAAPRLTFQARYADSLEPSFVKRGFRDSISAPNAEPYLPGAEEVRAVFA